MQIFLILGCYDKFFRKNFRTFLLAVFLFYTLEQKKCQKKLCFINNELLYLNTYYNVNTCKFFYDVKQNIEHVRTEKMPKSILELFWNFFGC